MKKLVIKKRGTIAHNKPNEDIFVETLPHSVIKKEAEMNEKFRDKIKLSPYCYLLRNPSPYAAPV